MRGLWTWLLIAGLLACGPLPAVAGSEHGKVPWQGWSDDLFRRALRIHVRRVDKVAAHFHEAVEDLLADLFGGFPAKRHRAQA